MQPYIRLHRTSSLGGMMMKEHGNLARGLVAGLGAGLIASLVMNQFQAAWMAMSKNKGSSEEPSTLIAANKISKSVAGEAVPKAAETAASDAVHYATGAALGAFYGAAAEFTPGIKAGLGTSYGGAVWAALDNGVVPGLKLSKPPSQIAPQDQLYAFASHMVFGLALEISRGVLARFL